MKKEVFLAVSVGFILGLLITFGIWTANRNLKVSPRPEITQILTSPSPEPTVTPSSPLVITLTSPEDELLTTSDSVIIAGKTSPEAILSIISESSEKIITADKTGAFTADVDLEGGFNRLLITAFDLTGNTASQELLVTYTTSKI